MPRSPPGSDPRSWCAAVVPCSAAASALDQLRGKKEDFDLVLSDVYMPGEQHLLQGIHQGCGQPQFALNHAFPLVLLFSL